MELQGTSMSHEEVNLQSFNDVMNYESMVTREELKDEYDIYLFAHLDNITNNLVATSNDLPFESNIDLPLKTNAERSEKVEIQLKPSKGKVTLDSSSISDDSKTSSVDGNNTSHYVWYKLHNGKQVRIWECGLCQKVFTHQYTLIRHLPTHTDERKFQCIVCGKAFRQMSTLSQHRAIHSSERPFSCEICQKNFNRVSTLISHRKTHTGYKPHRCNICTKAFHQKGNLRNHIFTHTNERPYKCDICEKGFNQMSNLMCHKLKAHQRTERPKFMCQVCGKTFAKRVGLRQHEQFTHKMVSPSEPSLPASETPEKINCTNAIIVEPIKTEAMRIALETNQTPFALLRPVAGIPVLVRVLPAGDKQMLVPASAEDLKKHSHISIMSQNEQSNGNQIGSTVQIKIPVVATVIQQNDQTGQMSMSVINPGPNGVTSDQGEMTGQKTNTFIYDSSITNCTASTSTANPVNTEISIEDIPIFGDLSQSGIFQDISIEYLDKHGYRMDEKDFQHQLEVTAADVTNKLSDRHKENNIGEVAAENTVPN